MEAALVSAATGALRPVLRKLAALLADEYKTLKGVRGEIKFLTDELAAMHAFLLNMSEEENHDVQDTVWMTAVRELSYDMEDSIDDFMQRVDDKDAKPDGFMDKIKHSLGKLGKMKTRHRIGSEFHDLKKQIIEVGERSARYRTRDAFANTRNATVDPRALAIFDHASKLVGIDEPKAKLIELLTQEDVRGSTRQVKLVSIVGFGGMGKTTLANQVYQDLGEEFKCRAFVSVSRNPDMMNILRTFLSELSGKVYAETEAGGIQKLIKGIRDVLKSRRYFVVVDDIWDAKTWDVIRHVFPVTSSGSKIITTTRINDVAKSCRSSFGGHIYNIVPLSMVHSRQLFCRRLFDSEEDCPSHLAEVCDQILKKCAGLPLAIIAISGLLANREKTENLWNQVKDSIGRALERNPSVEGMLQILSLSYYDLPPRLKTCLLYLSIFAEDSIIEKKSLIRRWIGEGFINKEGIYTSHELGQRCFNELVNRSLIQPWKTNVCGEVNCCRVHDTILDFIISKAIEENFVTLIGVPNLTNGSQTKVRRLSLQVRKQGDSIQLANLELSHVRSLHVFGHSREIPSMVKLRHLRVLVFEGCRQLENHHIASIGVLLQLRYLNIRDTGVSELPDQIGHLRCLEMLDLRGTHVRELPATIVKLRKLVDLLTDADVKFPNGIATMQGLEMLEQVGVFEQSFNFLQDLAQLKNMRTLHLDFEHHSGSGITEDCKKAIASFLHKLATHNLPSLTIWNDVSFLSESWCPAPRNLEKLMTFDSAVQRVPPWVGSLVNLQQLRLEVEGGSQEDICILGGLPSLLVLILEGTRKSEDRLRVSVGVGFRCLRVFCYVRYEAMDLMFSAGAMPKLEKLELQFEAQTFDIGIGNLSCLRSVKCVIGRGGNLEATKVAMERAAFAHPNRPTVLLTHLGDDDDDNDDAW